MMPWSALIGGVLIGVAATALRWFNGRIAGVSGIVGGLWFGPRGDRLWRVLFVVGLALGCAAWFGLTGQTPPRRSGFPRPGSAGRRLRVIRTAAGRRAGARLPALGHVQTAEPAHPVRALASRA